MLKSTSLLYKEGNVQTWNAILVYIEHKLRSMWGDLEFLRICGGDTGGYANLGGSSARSLRRTAETRSRGRRRGVLPVTKLNIRKTDICHDLGAAIKNVQSGHD